MLAEPSVELAITEVIAELDDDTERREVIEKRAEFSRHVGRILRRRITVFRELLPQCSDLHLALEERVHLLLESFHAFSYAHLHLRVRGSLGNREAANFLPRVDV